MKLSAYIINFDTGFAPNPFGRYCTLACCKPTIRRCAEPGDIIVGCASSRLPKPGYLVYAMRVKKVIPFQEYWTNARFASRKPSPRSAISQCGDNIWHQDRAGRWQVAPGACHNKSARERDTSGEHALVATEFFYFGRSAIRIPRRFSPVLARTQGHKNTRDSNRIDRERIEQFWDWVCEQAPRSGRIDYPWDFTEDGCRQQCSEIECDDIEET
jgi:Nucleotide modification associated domain 2